MTKAGRGSRGGGDAFPLKELPLDLDGEHPVADGEPLTSGGADMRLPHYPNAMKSWDTNWDVISPIFKFSSDVRKVIYTTNAIESLNSTYRKLNRQRSVFPSDTALLKALYLATFEATKKWSMPLRNWGKVYGELSIMYEDRVPQ